nr:ABC transporter substrate-binding protein [Baekduia alba]
MEATLAGRPVALGATKQRALLAMLALEPNAAVPVERLVDGLWGDDPPATARKMVQLYVSQLRRLLAGDDACIVTHGRGYELRMPADAIDVGRFIALVDDGEPRAALGLWRGPPLADVAQEPFAPPEIRRLEELRVRAAERAVDADLAAGRDDAALAELDRLIVDHPLRERLHARRMLALYRAGRQAEALEAYVAARERLVDAAGVEPRAELRDLQERILRQDPNLLLAAAAQPRPHPDAPGAPALKEADRGPGRPRRRVLLGVAVVVVLAVVAVVAVQSLGGPDTLAGIDEGWVGVIDPDARAITAQYPVTAAPQAVAGGDRSVWVADPGAGTVSRISADRRRVTTIAVGGSPSALAFGGGALWVADEDAGTVIQVDPATNHPVQTLRVGNGVRALAVGHGALWVAAALDGEVVRIDLRSGAMRHVAAGGLPVAVAVGRDAVWAVAEDSGRLVRLDPRTGAITEGVTVGNGPSAVAVGEGAVWVANRRDGTVSRIDPATGRERLKIPAGRAPSALAVAGGSVWVADADGGAVGRLDPGRDTIAGWVTTGAAPAGLATIDGDVWTTGAAPGAAHRGGTLRIGRQVFDPDPARGGYDPNGIPVLELAYDGLVRYRRAPGAASAQLVPALAVGVPEPTAGGRRYVFRLRRGGRYADGTPVRAGDLRTALERMLRIQGPELPPLYDAIVGAAGCGRRKGRCDLSRGVVADARGGTITINLLRPDPDLLQKLTLPLAALVPARTPRRTSRRSVPGTGPYRVVRSRPGHAILLARNRWFRPATAGGRAAGFVERVDVEMNKDEAVQLRAFARGELDMTGVFDLEAKPLAGLRAHYGTRLRSGAFAKTVYAWMNLRAPPFDDVRVRRALNLAVDRRAIVDTVGGPVTGSPTCQLLPAGFAGYRPTCPFTAAPSPAAAWVAPDLTKAQALVAASGRRGTRVVVWAPDLWAGMGRELVRTLHALGFRARLRLFAGLNEITVAGHDPRRHPQIGFGGWIADYPEPAGFLKSLVACAADTGRDPRGLNVGHYCDRGVDGAIERAQAAGPGAGDAWLRIERRIAARAPVVPLFNGRYPILTATRVGNVQFQPLTGPLLDAVWVR